MSRWKPLADGLGPSERELIIRLRELKDQVGIGTAVMARKTTYSKSSWDRYLNGVTRPPREAVEALGRLANAEPVRLLALWELADQFRNSQPKPADPPAHRTTSVRRRIAAAVLLVVAAGLMVWLLALDASSMVEAQSPLTRPSS